MDGCWLRFPRVEQFLNSLSESERGIIETYVKRTCASPAHRVINAPVSPAVNASKLQQLLLGALHHVVGDVINVVLSAPNNRGERFRARVSSLSVSLVPPD